MGKLDHRFPEQGETLGRVPLGLYLLLDGGGRRGPLWVLHGDVGLYSVRRESDCPHPPPYVVTRFPTPSEIRAETTQYTGLNALLGFYSTGKE